MELGRNMLYWIILQTLFINYAQAAAVCLGSRGTKYFLKNDEICCNRTVYNGTNHLGQKLSCCNGRDLYVEADQLCCGEHYVMDRFENGKERFCCRGDQPTLTDQVYDPSENEFCCRGVIRKSRKHQDISDFKCCGTILIDLRKRDCCQSRDFKNQTIRKLKENEKCCGANKYNIVSHWCRPYHDQVLPIGIDLCGKAQYKISTEVCCPGIVPEIKEKKSGPGDWRCMNGVVYDHEKQHVHERGHAHPIALDHGKNLCNNVVFEKETQECCHGCLHNKTKGRECCGTEYMERDSQKCCNNTIINPTVQSCCYNKIINNIDQGCCGYSVPYNLSREVCCESNILSRSRPVEKKKPTDTDCCIYDKKPYNRITEQCKKEGVCPKESDDSAQIKSDQTLQNEIQVQGESSEEVEHKSPFCSAGKLAQIQKTCERKNVFKGWVMSLNTTSKWTTMTLFGFWPGAVRGRLIDIQVRVKAKCIQQWSGFVWVITNRRLRKSGKLHSLKVTHRDLLMRDSRRNLKLRRLHCKKT